KVELVVCFFSRIGRHTIFSRDWRADVCSSDLDIEEDKRVRYGKDERGSYLELSPKGDSPSNPSPMTFVAGDQAYQFEVDIELQRSEERRVGNKRMGGRSTETVGGTRDEGVKRR